MIQQRSRRLTLLREILAAAILIASCAAGPARAGEPDSDWDEDEALFAPGDRHSWRSPPSLGMRDYFSRADLEILILFASLDQDQAHAARALHEGYNALFSPAVQQYRRYASEVYSDPFTDSDADSLDLIADAFDSLNTYARRLLQEFRDDLALILTQEQAARLRWIDLRRERLGLPGRFRADAHAPPDLTALFARELRGTPAPTGAAEVLERYEADLEALINPEHGAFARHREANMDRIDADEQRNALYHREATDLSDLTDAAVTKLTAMLPEEAAERFELAYLIDTRLAQIYGMLPHTTDRGRPDRIFERALRLPTLDEAQRQAIQDAYRLWRRNERQRPRPAVPAADPGRRHLDENNPCRWIMEQQEHIAVRLRAILTPEQQRQVGPPVARRFTFSPEDIEAEHKAPPPLAEQDDDSELESMYRMFMSLIGRPALSTPDLHYLRRAAGLSEEETAAARMLIIDYARRDANAFRKFFVATASDFSAPLCAPFEAESERAQADVVAALFLYRQRIRRDLIRDLTDILGEERAAHMEIISARSVRRGSISTVFALSEQRMPPDIALILERYYEHRQLPEGIGQAIEEYEHAVAEASRTIAAVERGFETTAESFRACIAQGRDDCLETHLVTAGAAAAMAVAHITPALRRAAARAFRTTLSLLPDEDRVEFEHTYYSAFTGPSEFMFRNWRSDPAEYRHQAEGLADLTETQRDALKEIDSRRMRERVAVYRGLYEQSLDAPRDDDDDHAIWDRNKEESNRLKEIDAAALRSMREALTPEQRVRMPANFRMAADIPAPRFP